MTTHPLNLHPHEVRALLDRRLTQIRRPMQPQPEIHDGMLFWTHSKRSYAMPDQGEFDRDLLGIWHASPYGVVGDVLIGRETWRLNSLSGVEPYTEESVTIDFKAGGTPLWIKHLIKDAHGYFSRWCSPVTMPAWASRWSLLVTAVRVERVQDATNDDIRASGGEDEEWLAWYEDAWTIGLPEGSHIETLKEHYACVWDSLYGKRYPWSANPWAWVYEIGPSSPREK